MSWTPYQLMFLASASASSSASISFTTQFTSTYKDYLIRVRGLSAATNAQLLLMTWSTNNGSSYISTNYKDGQRYFDTSASNQRNFTNNGSSFNMGETTSSTSGAVSDMDIYLYNMAQGTVWPSFRCIGNTFLSATSPIRGWDEAGGLSSTNNVNAVKFIMASGNIASGNFYLYGVSEP